MRSASRLVLGLVLGLGLGLGLGLVVTVVVGCGADTGASTGAGAGSSVDVTSSSGGDASGSSVTGDPGEVGEAVNLVSPGGWSKSAGDDPFVDEAPQGVDCEVGWGDEGGVFEVNTDTCAYGTFVHPALAAIDEGDVLELVLVHDALYAEEPADAHFALAIGASIVWSETRALPYEAEILRPSWSADAPHPEGAPIYFHVHNHGANSYRLVALTRTRE